MKFVWIALFAMTASTAADACTLNFREVKSAIDVNRAAVKSKGRVTYRAQTRTVNQTIVRKDGQTVNYSAGGCEHFTDVYTFPGQRVGENSREAFAQATEQLRNTPVTKAAGPAKNLLLESLVAAEAAGDSAGDDGVFYFPCGDATCYVAPTLSGDLSVSYTFAL